MQEFDRKEAESNKRMGYLFLILAVALIILAVAAVVFGYILPPRKGNDGEMHDWFGRIIDEMPPALSIVLPHWAGHIWLILDCLILLAMIIFIDRMFAKSKLYFTGTKNVDF
ncbi:MAG: hypothetical protein FWG34_05225 [Oscillospiraceae bacterium]|nr:hypothetical protein [Oscillospiraceae bacterium]